MIRHTVVFKIKYGISQEAIDYALQLLIGLKHILPGFLRTAGGICHFHENNSNQPLLCGFSIDFENQTAYDNFLNNPLTNSVKTAILNITEDGMNGIYGFDMGKSIESFPNPLDKYRRPIPRLLPPGAIR